MGLNVLDLVLDLSLDEIDHYLQDGVKDVQDRLIKGDPKAAAQFTTNITHNSNTGIPTLGGQIISVMRATTTGGDYRPCFQIDPNERFMAEDVTSLQYRSAYHAGYYVLDGLVFTVPEGSGSPQDTIKVNFVEYPTPINTDQHIGTNYAIAAGVTGTATNPSVFTAVGHAFMDGDLVYCTSFTQMIELNGLTLRIENTTLDTFELSGIAANPAETNLGADRGGTIERLSSTFPDQYERVVVLFAAMRCLQKIIAEMSAPVKIDISGLTVPTAPAPPLLSSDDATLQNSVGTITKTLSGVPPLYNFSNSALGLSTLQKFTDFTDFTALAPSIFDVPQPLAYPHLALSFDAPISTQIGYEDSGIEKTLQKLQDLTSHSPAYDITQYTVELDPWSFTESPNFSSILVPDFSVVQPFVANYSTLESELPAPWNPGTDVAAGLNSAGAAADLSTSSTQQINWTAFNAAMAEDDFEKATAELTKISQLVTLRGDQFSKQMDIYKEKVSRIGDHITNQVDKEWGAVLVVYQQKVAQYSLDVQNVFSKWTHDMNRESQRFTQTNTNKLSVVAHDMTNGMNKYTRDKAIFDAEVQAVTADINNAFQKATKNAELEDNMEIQNSINAAKRDLDQYQQDLKKYEVSVTRYNADVSSTIESYKTDLTKELDLWKTHMNNLLTKYKDDIGQTKAIYDSENVSFQANVQRDMAELQQNTEVLVQKMDLSTNVDLTNKAQKLQAEIQRYQGTVDLFISEFTGYKEQVATIGAVFASEMQSTTMTYDWLINQYNRLKSEYNENVGMQPQPPVER